MLQELHLLRVFQSLLSRVLTDALAVELDKHSLSAAQYRALQYIAHTSAHTRGCDVSCLATALGTSVPAATKMADRLEAAGWLKRHESQHDRRHTMLELTAKGQAVMRQLAGCEEVALQPLLERLSTVEREQLVQGMELLIRHVIKLPGLEDFCLYCGESHIDDCPLDKKE